MSRPDYLNECMSDFPTTPLDVFNLTWCVRCPNSTCSRSASSNHLFVHRADGWKDRLFDKVKRASDDDPAFAAIRSRMFIVKQPDSQEQAIAAAAPAPNPKFFQPLSVEGDEDEIEEVEEESPETDRDPVIVEPQPIPIPAPGPIAATNTPFVQGTVLPGAPPKREETGGGQTTYTFGEDDE